MKFNPYSLRFKLMLASTLVEVLMLSLLLLNAMRLINEAMLVSTDAALKQTVRMLNVATAPYLVQGDYATLQDNLNEMIGNVDQGVQYVVVRDNAQRVAAKAGIADVQTLPPPSTQVADALSGSVLHIERPLSLAGQPVGTLRFGLSTRIISQAKASVFQQSALIALTEIGLTFVLLSALGYWITRNLMTFVESSRSIADGHYDRRLPENGRDEVAKLARNFNRMSSAVEHTVGELRASEQQYRKLTEQLEARVEQRTRELGHAAEQMAESEKLASLARVVAGVAHELNTPIGNIVLMCSAKDEKLGELSSAIEDKTMTRSRLTQMLADMQQANRIVLRSAQRAAELIESFKRVAVDQTSLRRRKFNLRQTVDDVLNTVGEQIRQREVKVDVDVDPAIELDGLPSHIEQILNNLISNSIMHGFEGKLGGQIRIAAAQQGPLVVLDYRDDGHGIAKEVQHKVYEPFYTSKLGQGGSGLGMFIVHNLVVGGLAGQLQLESEPGAGVHFQLQFPAVTPE